MFIEFQTTGTNFLYLFREKLKGTPLALTDERVDAQGRTMIVNRVVVGNDTRLRFEKPANFLVEPSPGSVTALNGKRAQIVQPITVELVYLDDLIAHEDQPSPVTPLQIWVIFDVALRVAGGGVNLALTYAEVTGLLPPDVLAAIDAQLRASISPQSGAVDLDDLQEMLGGLEAVNAGIAIRPGTDGGAPGNVAMRIEFGAPELGGAEWQRFFNGAYDSLLTTPGKRLGEPPGAPAERWAVFISKDILERFLQKTLEDSFKKSKDLKLRSDIDVRWGNPDNRARLDARFKALAVDVCDLEPFGKYDMRLDIQIPVVLSVPANGTLREDLKINYWKNDIDAAACVVGVGMLWPIIGFHMMEDGKLKWWQYEALLVLVPARFVVAIIKANEKDLKPPNAKFTKISDDEFQSDQPFTNKKPGQLGYLELLDYRGLHSGVVLMGRQPPLPDTCAALIDAEHCDFEFKPPVIPCSTVAMSSEEELRHSVTGSVYGAGNGGVANVGEKGCPGLPQKVALQDWGHRLLDQALADQLKLQVIKDVYLDGVAITLRCPIPPPEYYANPQVIRLLLKTNGGARVFTYAPLKKLGEDEIRHLVIAGVAKSISDCKPMIAPWWKFHHGFNPAWHVDPPAFRGPGEVKLWVMTFGGVQPGDAFSASFGGRQVQTVRANSRGQAVLAVRQSAHTGDQLTLSYEPTGREVREPGGRMMMTQVALTHLGSAHLAAPVRSVRITRQQGARTMYCMHDDGYTVLDVSTPEAPAILAEYRGKHLQGVAIDERGAILFSEGRPLRVNRIRRRYPTPCAPANSAVRTLMGRDRFFVVRERSIDIFDHALCPQGSQQLNTSATDAALIDDRLIVAGPEGVAVIDTGSRNGGFTEFQIGPVTSVHNPDFGAPPGSMLLGTRTGFTLFELPSGGLPLAERRSDQFTPLAEYHELPWFAGATLFDSLLITADQAGKVSLESIVGRAQRCPHVR